MNLTLFILGFLYAGWYAAKVSGGEAEEQGDGDQLQSRTQYGQLWERLSSFEARIDAALAKVAAEQETLVRRLAGEVEKSVQQLTNRVNAVQDELSAALRKSEVALREKLLEAVENKVRQLLGSLGWSSGESCKPSTSEPDQWRILSSKMVDVALAAERQTERIILRVKHIAGETEERVVERLRASEQSLVSMIVSQHMAPFCDESVNVSELLPADGRSFRVLYDFSLLDGFESDHHFGGGWIVFQRRFDGSLSFDRSWAEYRAGFGDVWRGEFWLGLQNLYALMRFCPQELLVVLENSKGALGYAHYDSFSLANEREQYAVKQLGKCRGYACGVLDVNKFSTNDRDNSLDQRNCSGRQQGGWWYYACHYEAVNLNSAYRNDSANASMGVAWDTYDKHGIRSTKMMIRRRHKAELVFKRN